MPDLSDPREAVEWMGENLPEKGWEGVREELEANPQLETLVTWFDTMTDGEREGYLLCADGREEVIAWLLTAGSGGAPEAAGTAVAQPAVAATEPAAAEPTAGSVSE